jgi:glycosyltransferase involved in cell wall biosynthesis
MKILWFNWRCWLNPDMGGAEVFTREVSKRWVEAGNDVTLFTAEFPGSKKEEVAQGVRIVRSGGRFLVYHQAKKFYVERFKKQNFDVVIDEINTVPFFTPRFVENGEKIVALIHQLAREYWFYETSFPVNYLGHYLLENRWLRNYLDVPTVTVSNSTQRDLIDFGFKHVFIVPEGLNFQPLEALPEKSRTVIVFVGRLKRAKRPDHALLAFRRVKKEIPDAELWFLGDGPFIKVLKKKGVDGVRFFGHLSNLERRNLIQQSSVLVNPSIREGWGLNVIEANALGVPAVAYDVPGLRDSVKDCETGLLAKNGVIDDLSDKIICILKDQALRKDLSRNALKYSKEFNWDKTAAELLNVLK